MKDNIAESLVCYGYNEDSIKDKKVYNEVITQYDKLNSLNVNWSKWEDVAQEEETFTNKLNKILEV